jgi:hypothetical protein
LQFYPVEYTDVRANQTEPSLPSLPSLLLLLRLLLLRNEDVRGC